MHIYKPVQVFDGSFEQSWVKATSAGLSQAQVFQGRETLATLRVEASFSFGSALRAPTDEADSPKDEIGCLAWRL